MGQLLIYGEKRINHTDLSKIIALCKEHFEESYFDKSVDLRRRLININEQ